MIFVFFNNFLQKKKITKKKKQQQQPEKSATLKHYLVASILYMGGRAQRSVASSSRTTTASNKLFSHAAVTAFYFASDRGVVVVNDRVVVRAGSSILGLIMGSLQCVVLDRSLLVLAKVVLVRREDHWRVCLVGHHHYIGRESKRVALMVAMMKSGVAGRAVARGVLFAERGRHGRLGLDRVRADVGDARCRVATVQRHYSGQVCATAWRCCLRCLLLVVAGQSRVTVVFELVEDATHAAGQAR